MLDLTPRFLKRLLAMALVSATVILLQITFTRILSVVVWYHWAFLSISIAMLGLGAPGVWFSFRKPGPSMVYRLLLAAGALAPMSVVGVLATGRVPPEFAAVACMLFMLPTFLCLGAVVCLFLLEARGDSVGTMYGADLLGAACGALIVIPLMRWIPTPQLSAACGLLPLGAYLLLGTGRRRWALPVVLAIVGLLLWEVPLTVKYSKSLDQRRLPLLHERWTPTARLTFFEGLFWAEDQREGFVWGQGDTPRHRGARVEQYWMEQDGSAGSPIVRFDGQFEPVAFLDDDVTTVAYQIAKPQSVAIVGAGGGRDIISALGAGAETVDAIELNGEIVDTVSGRFGAFSGDIYHRPGVTAVVSEARNYLTRTDQRYDLIQISLIDSWAATAAGAFTLSENNLYTEEAFRLFWNRLSEVGILSTSRWMRGQLSMELPRLVALVRSALIALGIEEPAEHVAVVQGSAVGTVLVSRLPFRGALLSRLRTVCAERGFVIHFPEPGGQSGRLLQDLLAGGPSALAQTGLDLTAPVDDRPFFFQVLPVFRIPDRGVVNRLGINAQAVFALQILIFAVVVITLCLFFLPFAIGPRLRGSPGFWRGSGYFATIGLGFLLVEIPWLQRFILFLGHPSFATTVVLASMLLGAGVGSLLSRRVGLERLSRWGFVLPLLIGAVNLLLGPLFRSGFGAGIGSRIALSAVLLVPIGTSMGLFFPLGLQRFGDENKAWFWAVNGACSVLASVLSLALAMEFGFSRVVWIATVLYGAAWLLLRGERPPASQSGTRSGSRRGNLPS